MSPVRLSVVVVVAVLSLSTAATTTAAPGADVGYDKPTRVRMLWYKPHYQCGEEPGSTPDVASAFINAHMDETDGMDFVAISEWAPTVEGVPPIGNPPLYGSTASVCGYGSEEYITPIVLFHRRDRWELLDSFPPADPCRDVVPLPSMSGDEAFGSCANTTTPGAEDCCVCTFSEDEYAQGAAWGQYTGQRPWVAGIYRDRRAADELGASDRTVCVVAAETPHPLWYSEILNIDGVPTNSSSFSIMRYICTYQYSPALCVPNLSETSIIFGTDVFVSGVSDFCGELPIIIAADTNAAMGDFNAALFLTTDSLRVTNTEHRLWPYTCCNDTASGGGMNRYASDRIMLIDGDANTLMLDTFEGGSVAPGGPLPDGLGYQCHAAEEHAPYRIYFELS